MSATAHSPHAGTGGGFEVVTLVASLGGLPALSTVLAGLPASFPARVLVVQHGRAGTDPGLLGRLLQRVCPLPVGTARDGAAVDGPGVTVIPPGTDATLGGDRNLRLFPQESSVRGGDRLMRSVATAVGPAAIAVILTGRLHDGSEGARAIKRNGGRVLAEDPATAYAPGMPSAALATGCVDLVLPVHRIPAALIALSMAPGGADLLSVPTPPWAKLHA